MSDSGYASFVLWPCGHLAFDPGGLDGSLDTSVSEPRKSACLPFWCHTSPHQKSLRLSWHLSLARLTGLQVSMAPPLQHSFSPGMASPALCLTLLGLPVKSLLSGHFQPYAWRRKGCPFGGQKRVSGNGGKGWRLCSDLGERKCCPSVSFAFLTVLTSCQLQRMPLSPGCALHHTTRVEWAA